MTGKTNFNFKSLNPLLIEKGLNVISIYIENGITKFSDILDDVYARDNNNFQQFFDMIKLAYCAYYVLADDTIAEQMDSNIRNIT